jgi:hypothetical protein
MPRFTGAGEVGILSASHAVLAILEPLGSKMAGKKRLKPKRKGHNGAAIAEKTTSSG